MNLNVGQITLIDLINQIERKEVTINRNYQRGSGIWPPSAKSYFIDTILEGYPFPKIYLYQIFNQKTNRPIKEIVDGQQRIGTIIDFYKDKFKLTSSSNNFSGMKFSDLPEDIQQSFVSYQVETSTILSATRPELLEMFRRINAYTAPLSPAEKRHSMYQGEFKWFVVEQADKHSPTLEDLGIFTSKQLARMADSEFIADLVATLTYGIVAKSAKTIEQLYKDNDLKFENAQYYSEIINDFFNVLKSDLSPLHETFMMKSYAVNTLFSAYTHCKYGIHNGEELTNITPSRTRNFNFDSINHRLDELATAHEEQDEEGHHSTYVKSCISSTTKLPQRTARFKIVANVFSES